MSVRSRPVQSVKSSEPRAEPERCMRVRTAPFAVAVLVLALAGCASRLPAPVDSRVDETVPKQAAAETPASAPRVAAAPSEAPESLAPLPAAAPASTDAGLASSGTMDATGALAESTEIAPKRLAALNPAIMELLNDANRRSAEGRHDGAAAALERALQIEPKDAALWHRLARTRLDQGRLTSRKHSRRNRTALRRETRISRRRTGGSLRRLARSRATRPERKTRWRAPRGSRRETGSAAL